jgi:hypothetical protein
VLLVAVKPSRVTGGTEAVALVADPGAGCCATAAEIERDGDSLIESAGRWSAGRATKTRLILVVPDGVHRVKFAFPSQAETVVVHGNVAAVQADEPCCTGQPALIWYGANGGVIKRIASRYPPPTSHRPARLPAPR